MGEWQIGSMNIAKTCRGAGTVARKWRMDARGVRPWHLRWQPVCASTEIVMAKWLQEKPFIGEQPRAIFADRQTHGRGQQGRVWHSKKGGVWVSAAIPGVQLKESPELLGLAIAAALSETLEKYGVPVSIKWPNDLLVGDRKLAGILPSLLHRGKRIRLARIGLGLNISNQVPKEGIALNQILKSSQCEFLHWKVEALLAFDRAMEFLASPDALCLFVERRLWSNVLKDPETGELWEIEGLELDGALKLRRGPKRKIWKRWDPTN